MTDPGDFVTRCVPSAGLYCQQLATRVRGPLQAPILGFGYLASVRVEAGSVKNVFEGIGFKHHPGMPGLLLNFCPWCGTRILREDKPVNTGQPPTEDTDGNI